MSFEEILLNVIDEEFSSLGGTCQKIIYFYLKKEYNLERREIPFNIKEFSQALESMFKNGATILQIRIMENLYRKMGYISQRLYEKETLDFVQYIQAAKATIYKEEEIENPLFPTLM